MNQYYSRLARSFPLIVATAVSLCIAINSTPMFAVVVISDGFGDGDLNNDGTLDGNVQGSVEDETWIPGRLFVDGMSDEPENTEVTTALDAQDTGIRWIQMRGFTSAQGNFPGAGDSKPRLSIVNDGGQIETTTGTGGINRPALDGYAMSWESKGGGSSAAGFFDQNVALGPNVGDQVKVSFDFRLWGDTPNAEDLMPDASELRFGLYQDTDDELGTLNPFAGRQVDENGDPLPDQPNLLTPNDFSDSFRGAVWGQDEGLFSGRLKLANIADPSSLVGAIGDTGYQAGVFVGDNFTNAQQANGGGTRIREEQNTEQILQGSSVNNGGDISVIAQPENLNPDPLGTPIFDFVNMETEKKYNIALTLERATTTEEGDSIMTILTITDIATSEEFTLSGVDEDPLSEDWDYFALRNATSGADEIDFLIDNFLLETFSTAGLPGDFNNDGTVDAVDYAVWRDNLGGASDDVLNGNGDGVDGVNTADYDIWKAEFGNSAAGAGALGAAATPEPSSVVLLSLLLGMLAWRRP